MDPTVPWDAMGLNWPESDGPPLYVNDKNDEKCLQ